MDEGPFSLLPRETKKIIASFLSDRSRRMMRTTSTEWFNIINYDDFTIYFARSSMLPELIRTFSRYSKPIGLQFEKTIHLNNSFTILASLTNLTRLEVEPSRYYSAEEREIEREDLEHFTALTALQKLIFAENFTPYIIRHFPNLTHVIIKGVYESLLLPVGSGKINPAAKLGNITRLRSLEVIDHYGVLGFDEESVAKMSHVSKVSFSCRGVKFPFSKLPNLESLSIENTHFDDFSVNTKLTWLSVKTAHPLFQNQVASPGHDYQQLTALENLRYLDLGIDINEDQYCFLSKLTNLESLRVTSRKATGQYLQFVNSSKLTSIDTIALPSILESKYLTNLRHLEYEISLEKTTEIPFKLTNLTSLLATEVRMAKYCPNVKSLQIYNYETVHEREALSSLSQLESLHLFTINNSVLHMIGELTKLTQLIAQFDPALPYDFEALKNLTALRVLKLHGRPFGGNIKSNGLLPGLRLLTNLEELELFQIDDVIIDALESLPKLKHLIIKADIELFDEDKLSNLTNLQTLKLLKRTSFGIRRTWHECKLKHLPYLYDCFQSK